MTALDLNQIVVHHVRDVTNYTLREVWSPWRPSSPRPCKSAGTGVS